LPRVTVAVVEAPNAAFIGRQSSGEADAHAVIARRQIDLAFAVAMPDGVHRQLLEGRWDTAAELLEDRVAIATVATRLPYFGGWV